MQREKEREREREREREKDRERERDKKILKTSVQSFTPQRPISGKCYLIKDFFNINPKHKYKRTNCG